MFAFISLFFLPPSLRFLDPLSHLRLPRINEVELILPLSTAAQSLQSQLNDHFAQSHIDPLREPPVVSLRPTNRHLEIRGKWVEEVKGWLESRGF
jgi:large subunit ribosomal protein L49